MNTVATGAPPARTPVEKLPLARVADVKQLLANEQALAQLRKVAAKHMNPERMMRVLANAIRTTPKLQQAEPLSMLGALMNCAALGLEPNTQLGHAYLVPFDKSVKSGPGPRDWSKVTQVQLIIGYKGFIDLARRSGQIRSLHADVVYDDDLVWDYAYGLNYRLEHKPGPRKGEKLGAYCYAHTADGGFSFIFKTTEEILTIRDASQGWRAAVATAEARKKPIDSPWANHEDRMFAKTAVRALANAGEMPLSIEFIDAMESDDRPMDFANFALEPSIGGPRPDDIEGEVEDLSGGDHDPETGEVVEPERPEPKPAAAARAAPKTEAAKAASKPPAKAAAKDSSPSLPLDGDRDADLARMAKKRDDIINEFVDANVDAVLEANRDILEEMERIAPNFVRDVEDVAGEYRAGAPE